MTADEILRALVDHCAAGGTVFATNPLLVAAQEALATSSPRPRLPVRVGLSAEELARRRATLGSSEIAAVVGVNPYASAHNVWLSKVMGVDFEGNEATELGNLLEPSIFAIYAARYNRELVRGQYTLGPEPWISATPDAHIVGGGLVEAKLVGLRQLWMWGAGNTDEQESDAIPLHYLCQAQWQMIVTGDTFVDVSALMGTEFRSFTVRANAQLQAQLVARGRDFWERYVVTKEAPPVDASDGAKEMLKRLYPQSDAEPIEATPALNELAASLTKARGDVARASAEKQLLENQIKSELRDARGAAGDGWRIRYKTTKTGSRPFVFESDEEKESKVA